MKNSPLIATPISHQFENEKYGKEIEKVSDCLEVRERSLDSKLKKQHLFHIDIDLTHKWDKDLKKYLYDAFSLKPDLKLITLQATRCCEKEKLEDGTTRTVLNLPAPLAPNKVAILPLVKKGGLPEKAKEIMKSLQFNHQCHYEEKDSIGKRYRRQDAIGTPFCITIDHDTLNDLSVTIRERDTMSQERVPITELHSIIDKKVSIHTLL